MSNNINKTSIEKALADLEQIRKYAQEKAEKKLQEEVDKKILNIINEKLNENVNISVDEEGNVEVSKDGEEVASISASEENSEEIENTIDGSNDEKMNDDEEFVVSDDEEPIDVFNEENIANENMQEMDNIKMEQEAQAAPANAAPTTPAAPAAEAPAVPAEETPAVPAEEVDNTEETDGAVEQLVSKLDTLINLMMQQQGVSGEQTQGQEFEVIDDEAASAAPAPTAETPAPTAEAPAPTAETPVQEEMEFEITDFETGDKVLEIVDDINDTETVTIVDEDEMPEDGSTMEETRGLGFTSKRTGDKTLKMGKMEDEKGHHAPVTAINENKLNKIKAQYESKIDELVKENKSLNKELGDLKLTKKEFEEAFVQLREQFDEMQTFNGKLALVNKLLMNGGLSFEEKLKVCEQFDSADTIEEAQKLYKNIIKENNIKISDASSKIKASTTHTAKPTGEVKALYESEEARRMKQLAGIKKSEQ